VLFVLRQPSGIEHQKCINNTTNLTLIKIKLHRRLVVNVATTFQVSLVGEFY